MAVGPLSHLACGPLLCQRLAMPNGRELAARMSLHGSETGHGDPGPDWVGWAPAELRYRGYPARQAVG
jgi:hypothetical protein